jgi:hypothetical protein
MRLLKLKITKARQSLALKQSEKPSSITNEDTCLSTDSETKNLFNPKRSKKAPLESPSEKIIEVDDEAAKRQKLANKNIIKNFGRAIANFASSELATPYLEEFTELKKDLYKGFINYAMNMRNFIQNIDSFKEAILPIE